MVISSDSLFIRGQIEEGEKFFIVAQSDLDLPTKKKISLNYLSVKCEDKLTFSPTPLMTSEPMYFTHQIKNNKVIIYYKNKKIIKDYLDFAPTRIVDKNNIFSGVWYYLSLPDSEIPWIFENPILKPEILKSSINGYYQNISSQTFKKFTPNRTTVFSFIPKKYFTSNNEKKRSFPSYLEWLQTGATITGGTKNNGQIQFAYPIRRRNMLNLKPTSIPKKEKIHSFTEILREEKEKEKEKKKKKLPEEEPKTSNKFYIVISLIILAIIGVMTYFNFFHTEKPKSVTAPSKETKSSNSMIIPIF